jgi:hypothetical protein
MKALQMNLMFLLKPHQYSDLTILAIPSLNFLTTIRVQTCAIPSTLSTTCKKNKNKNKSSHCPHKGNAYPLDDFTKMECPQDRETI